MKPFLCCDADINKIQFPVLVLPKIDGVRMLRDFHGLLDSGLKRIVDKQ